MLLIEHILSLKPVTGTTILIILFIATASYVRNVNGSRYISVALFVSLAFALYATVYGNHIHFVAGCSIAACICIAGESMECKAIASLYAARVLLSVFVELDAMSMNTMWSLNLLFLWLQLIIAGGTIAPESGRKKISTFASNLLSR